MEVKDVQLPWKRELISYQLEMSLGLVLLYLHFMDQAVPTHGNKWAGAYVDIMRFNQKSDTDTS